MIRSKLLVWCLLIALQAPVVHTTAGAPLGGLRGTILDDAGGAPLGDVRVLAGDPRSGKIWASERTAADGRFDLPTLPGGTYDLAVEVERGLYLVSRPVVLDPGRKQQVNISVSTAAEETDQAPAPPPKPSLWNNPLTASLIVIGTALVVGALVENATDDNDEAPASDFN